jgi:hypothetical protein
MDKLTKKQAYLIKSGVPFDRAVSLTEEQAAELGQIFRDLELENFFKGAALTILAVVTLAIVASIALAIAMSRD